MSWKASQRPTAGCLPAESFLIAQSLADGSMEGMVL